MADYVHAPHSLIRIAGQFDPDLFPDGKAPDVLVFEDYAVVRRGDIFVAEPAVPDARTGSTGQIIQVNSAEDGYELIDPPAGSEGRSVGPATEITGPVTDSVFDVSHSLDAGELNGVGRYLRSRFYASITGGLSATAITLKMRLGGTVVFTHSSFNSSAGNVRWCSIQNYLRVTTAGATGTVEVTQTEGVFNNTTAITATAPVSTSSIDLTSALTVDYTVTIGSSGNKSQLLVWFLETLQAA